MPIELYYNPTPGSCRAVLMLARDLGVDMDAKVLRFVNGLQLQIPDHLKVSATPHRR